MLFPKTAGQCKYALALQGPKPIVIATGPAGTGKTVLACAHALEHRKKIVLCRPLVSVDGEEIGALPGDIDSKLAPWSRPAMSFLEKNLTRQQLDYRVSVEALGHLRGRTFEDTVLICDEMQNASRAQFKMILTRLGHNTKLILTGDLDQSDLPSEENGLAHFLDATSHLRMEYVDFVELDKADIVRHPAIEEVLKVYNA